MTIPPLAMQILRLLADTPRTSERLREIIPGTAKAHVNRCVEKLRMDGLIVLKWGKWHLSKTGRRGIPAPAPVVVMRPYTPPVRPPRRAGSDHCYAEAWDRRYAWSEDAVHWGAGKARRRTSAANWRLPLRWNAKRFMQCDACGWRGECAAELIGCGACGSVTEMNDARRRVFCASLADVFDNEVPTEWRWDLFRVIAATPRLDWIILTKRIGNACEMLNEAAAATENDFIGAATWDRSPWHNVWLGATVVNQPEADRDIPKLLDTPAAVRFVSIEPMLGEIRLGSFLQRAPSAAFADGRVTRDMPEWTRIGGTAIDWVICGGESGPHARPMHPDWVRSLRDQCSAAGVPFLFKQWGEWLPWHHFCDAQIDDPPERTRFITREWCGDEWVDVGRPDIWDSKDGHIDEMQCIGRVGKKAAGRLLEGREWNEFPTEATGP